MALTDFEKQMVDIIDSKCRRSSTDPTKRASNSAHLDTLLKGDEAEVQALIHSFITDEDMVTATETNITILQDKVTGLNTLKADMANYIA